MSVPREPDGVLGELGARLAVGYAADAGRRRLGVRLRASRRRHAPGWLLVLAGATLLGGPAAFATRDVLRDAPLPALPGAARAPGAVAPDAASGQVVVATGQEQGVAWKLSASACRYGRLEAVGLFLTVPGGGGGARCDAAALAPRALAARRVQVYFDPVTTRTWVFGALPGAAVRAEVRTRSYAGGADTLAAAPATPAAPGSVARGIPGGLRTFVLAVPGSRDLAAVTVRDARGAVVLRCVARRCTP